ncbi:unnamed protein product [Orchesella dallaii]|uniref:Uncharacterized protein n=1 Tax=Orchesella dallaii TaxID=48710 RepID=A0ABP1Q6X6_9HEXA
MGHIQNLLKGSASAEKGIIRKPLWKLFIAEFIGTALLVFLGCGCVLKLNPEDHKLLVGIALCWGFTIATLAQTLGNISCDINPAVTLACLATGRTTIVKCIVYIIAQCLGALGGIGMLKLLMPDSVMGNWAITKLALGVTPLQGFLIEVVCTFLLVFTVFSASDERRTDLKGSVPLSIGLCVAGIILFAGPLTGASLNPARSLGPSVFAGHFENHWVC